MMTREFCRFQTIVDFGGTYSYDDTPGSDALQSVAFLNSDKSLATVVLKETDQVLDHRV